MDQSLSDAKVTFLKRCGHASVRVSPDPELLYVSPSLSICRLQSSFPILFHFYDKRSFHPIPKPPHVIDINLIRRRVGKLC